MAVPAILLSDVALGTRFAQLGHSAVTLDIPGLPRRGVAVTMRAFNGERHMPTSFLEIVELPDGTIVLRRGEDEGVLVSLDFSDDAKVFLQGQHLEIAKAMFSVGVQMAGRVSEGEIVQEEGEGPHVLH